MTREEAISELKLFKGHTFTKTEEALDMAIEALEQEPCGDAISRQAVLEELENGIKAGNYEEGYEEYPHINDMDDIIEYIKYADSIQPKTWQFAKWVATEIFDDMWEYNKDAFAEIACRKLAKIGIVRANGDEWELVEPQESDVGEEIEHEL